MQESNSMCYELTSKELGFLFRIRHESGQAIVVHTKMKPYQNRDMIQLLKERAGSMQQAKDDFDAYDMKEGSAMAGKEFFDRHKIEVKLNGTVLDDAQIDKLDARWDIKNTVIEHGYNGIYRVQANLEQELQKLDVEDILGDTAIKTRFSLTNSREEEQEIFIPHFFEFPTAMDSLAWDRAQIQQGLRQGGFRVNYNHEALNTLYNRKIGSVWDAQSKTGMLLGGKPCVKENKDEWVDEIPYLMKRAALGFLFSKAERAARGNG